MGTVTMFFKHPQAVGAGGVSRSMGAACSLILTAALPPVQSSRVSAHAHSPFKGRVTLQKGQDAIERLLLPAQVPVAQTSGIFSC